MSEIQPSRLVRIGNGVRRKHGLYRWAEVLGFRDRVLRDRLFRYGWSIDKAFTTLVRKVDG